MVEAHTHFSWNDQPSLDAIQRMPPEEHILWCAEVAKRYLDMGWTSLRRRRGRQAAARRGDPQRHQRRHHHRPALPGGEPGDHGARRPGRHHAAAPAATGVRVRRHRQRPARDAPLRAHVRQVRRRHAEDQPVAANRSPACRARPASSPKKRSPSASQEAKAWGKRVAAHARSHLVDQAVRQAGHRGDLPRELRRRRGARPARAAQVRALRRARPGLADQHLPPRVAMGPDARGDAQDGLPPRARVRDREHEGDAQARHPHPARRRLRLRVDAARHQREGPGVLRQARRHEHDGGAAVGHRVGRADDEAWASSSATSAKATWPTSC